MAKNTKKVPEKIKGIDLILNAKNKLNSSMPEVYRGTGIHKNKKAYTRKAKHKNQNY